MSWFAGMSLSIGASVFLLGGTLLFTDTSMSVSTSAFSFATTNVLYFVGTCTSPFASITTSLLAEVSLSIGIDVFISIVASILPFAGTSIFLSTSAGMSLFVDTLLFISMSSFIDAVASRFASDILAPLFLFTFFSTLQLASLVSKLLSFLICFLSSFFIVTMII